MARTNLKSMNMKNNPGVLGGGAKGLGLGLGLGLGAGGSAGLGLSAGGGLGLANNSGLFSANLEQSVKLDPRLEQELQKEL